MKKGESIISIALTVLLVFLIIGVQRRWSGTTFRNMASSAENFVLKTTGLRSGPPDLPGYQKVRTFHLGDYSAVLYRVTPAPLVFATYQFILFDRENRPVFKSTSLEASRAPWTTLYDFAGRRGLPDRSRRGHPVYTRDLTGDGSRDVVLGQYSGGDRCCATITVIELGKQNVRVLAKIQGIEDLPFQSLEVRKLDRSRSWQFLVHRPYRPVCGPQTQAAGTVSIFAYQNGQFIDQTQRFQPYFAHALQDTLARWSNSRNRSLALLQSVAIDYSLSGQTAEGQQFFNKYLPLFYQQLKLNDITPQVCTQNVANLLNSLHPVQGPN